MNAKPIVFVSHVHGDTKLATTIKEEISKLLLDGVEFFVSSDNTSIIGGDRWLDKVENALSNAALVLILCDDTSISRPWVNFEAGGAWTSQKRVVPLCFGSLRIEDLPQPLSSSQSFNLSDPEHLRNLIKIISDCADLRVPEFDPDKLVRKLEVAISDAHIQNLIRNDTDSEEIRKALRIVSRHIGQEVLPEQRETVLAAVSKTVAPLQQLQQRLKDWAESADEWINDFHTCMDEYARIYATDVFDRSSIGSPRFDLYLRKQYSAKLRALSGTSSHSGALFFSKQIIDAIDRTGWKPNSTFWQPPMESKGGIPSGLEIVRILIRPTVTLNNWEKDALHVIDFDHTLYGIPLFVIDADRLDEADKADFAIGFGRDGAVNRCYEFLRDKGEVAGQTIKRGKQLEDLFLRMIEDPTLKTVSEYLGNVMIRDPEKSEDFTAEYDNFRTPSNQIVQFILDNVNSGTDKIGLDVGCGTGNYTIPFVEKFHEIFGVDINDNLLEKAREKAKKADLIIKFVKADAVCMPFESGNFDAIWSVSTLHYLKGKSTFYANVIAF